jgi:NitT/TauT family transport system ATP-binding protein
MVQDQHIAVRGLRYAYESEGPVLTALAAVDLEVGRGEFLSVIGPSGGGKTTLLKVIGGLLEPTSGTVAIGGLAPGEARRRKEIGYVFQDPALLPWRTVVQNIALPLEVNRGEARSGEMEPERLLDVVGLREFRDYHPHRLSGGMRQRVALARSLVTDPSVLLMDEPLGSLDEITRAAMRYELLRVWEVSRKTVVMITHSIAEAVMMSDRVAVLSHRPGRVVGEVAIDLPRPRDESLEHSRAYREHTNRVKEVLSFGSGRGASLG